jgi:hypothetical protein
MNQLDKYTMLVEPGIVWSDYTSNASSSEVSADGQCLVRRNGPYPHSITLLDLKSGREETVVDRDAGCIFGWISGGAKLLYSKHRAGGLDLWAIGVKDGKPTGEPELVWRFLHEVSIWPLAITGDGSIYYLTSTSRRKFVSPEARWGSILLFSRPIHFDCFAAGR